MDDRRIGFVLLVPRSAQCRSPNDPRHGSVPASSDAPPGLGKGPAMCVRCLQAPPSPPKKGAVQRRQEAKPLHETGVVSRVPRSARWAEALETDINTDQSAAHTGNGRNEQERAA